MAATRTSARDIPKMSGRDTFAAVTARSVPATRAQALPTPPNSISPSLPPHGLKPYGTRSATAQLLHEHVDSDLDLQDDIAGRGRVGADALEHDVDLPDSDTLGAITPSMLAQYHLPEILLNHGPLAIRHIMGYLTTSVPGFSGIPPAKARRVVVAALESRSHRAEDGGAQANVKFEKVGWGRWDARTPGRTGKSARPHSPPASMPNGMAVPISTPNGPIFDRTRLHPGEASWTNNSDTFSHDDLDMMSFDHEADKMSLDGDASCTSSEIAPEDEIMNDDDDPEDMTDDEDWAAVGAAALRAASCSASGPAPNFFTSRYLAKLVPLQPSLNAAVHAAQHDFSSFGGMMASADSQEREAVEALLRLGSV